MSNNSLSKRSLCSSDKEEQEDGTIVPSASHQLEDPQKQKTALRHNGNDDSETKPPDKKRRNENNSTKEESDLYGGNVAAACKAANAETQNPADLTNTQRKERLLRVSRIDTQRNRDRKRIIMSMMEDNKKRLTVVNGNLKQESAFLRALVDSLKQQRLASQQHTTNGDVSPFQPCIKSNNSMNQLRPAVHGAQAPQYMVLRPQLLQVRLSLALWKPLRHTTNSTLPYCCSYRHTDSQPMVHFLLLSLQSLSSSHLVILMPTRTTYLVFLLHSHKVSLLPIWWHPKSSSIINKQPYS